MSTNEEIMKKVNDAYNGKVLSECELRIYEPSHMDLAVKNFINEAELVALGSLYSGRKFQYALELIRCSRVLDHDNNFRYWSPADTLDGMPGDARVDLMYIPTYVATSALLVIYDKCTKEHKDILREPISQAMHACCGRNFQGHGYEAEEGFLDAMGIFEKLGINEIVKEYPDLSKEFTYLYESAEEYYSKIRDCYPD